MSRMSHKTLAEIKVYRLSSLTERLLFVIFRGMLNRDGNVICKKNKERCCKI